MRWPKKPPVGVPLNGNHPLTRGLYDWVLVNEGGGLTRNLGFGGPNTAGAANVWSSGAAGRRVTPGTGAPPANEAIEMSSATNYAAGDFTFRLIFEPTTWSGAAADIYSKGNEFRSFFNDSGHLSFISLGGTDTDMIASPILTGFTTGSVWDYVLTRSGSTVTAYGNGLSKGTTTNGGTTASNVPLVFNGDQTRGTGNPVYSIYLVQFWTRCLPPGEIQRLSVEAYAMYVAPVRRAVRLAAAAVAAALGSYDQVIFRRPWR